MEDVVVRMRRVSEDLRAIQHRLEQMRPQMGSERVVEEVLQLELIRDFKTAIDQIRLFLWEYFESAAQACGDDVACELQAFRLKRATELLRSIQDEVPATNPRQESRSFFDTIQQLADVAVERHLASRTKAETTE